MVLDSREGSFGDDGRKCTVLRYDGTPIHLPWSHDTKHMTSIQPGTLS